VSSMIVTVRRPQGWRFGSLDDWESERNEWHCNPLDESWAVVRDQMDWSEYTLLTLMTKSRVDDPRGTPSVWIGTFREEHDLCAFEMVEQQLLAVDGLCAGLNLLRGPEEIVLGGLPGYAATYSYLYERKQQESFTQLEEFSAVLVEDELLVAIFGGPADSITEQVRKELMEIRASVRFIMDGLNISTQADSETA
jgi:hypothetical protein